MAMRQTAFTQLNFSTHGVEKSPTIATIQLWLFVSPQGYIPVYRILRRQPIDGDCTYLIGMSFCI